MTYHPLATQAILGLAFYPINQLRVGKLKRPLARWLTQRMSHNYRQAQRIAMSKTTVITLLSKPFWTNADCSARFDFAIILNLFGWRWRR